ncbi:hypothetical protein ABT263_19150 [Kitasatospora sp. NPDC001603]|uniref:hypothetical protein n=1 Tax=Kitasatospora sp. NPDC001603 TaxID=3154388 RepID=UPI00331A5B79
MGDMLESDAKSAALAGLTGIRLDRGIGFVTGGTVTQGRRGGAPRRTAHRPARIPLKVHEHLIPDLTGRHA